MKKIVFSLFLSLISYYAFATDGGLVEAGKLYEVPSGSFDIDYTTTEAIPAGQTVVVFYYTHKQVNFTPRNFAFGTGYKEFSYSNEVDADRNLVVRIYDTKGIVKAGMPLLINLYSPLEEGGEWAYVICSEADKQTVASPFGTAIADQPGQTEETAFALTTAPQSVTAAPSKTSATAYVIYAKFTAEAEGKVFFNFPADATAHYFKAEGDSYKTFSFENGCSVLPGQTYYVWFIYNKAVSGNISYELVKPQEGEARSTAIPVTATETYALLGKPSIGTDYYYNVTTWFHVDAAATEGKHQMAVTLSGENSGEVALWAEGQADPVKAYGIGKGTGMIPFNSTINFDINPGQSYFVSITQDNTGGKATFDFKTVEPGQTKSTALEATTGYNDAIAGYWYRYTHSGETMTIAISNVANVYNQNDGFVASGGDVAVGFRIKDGETIYFQAASDNFTIKSVTISEGMTPDMPVILTLGEYGGSFSFQLNGAESDVTRYIQYTATESGTIMYGTDHKQVVEMALGSTVTDKTTGRYVSVVQQKQNFGSEYYTYAWQVTAGHTYLIEQTLVGNLGDVTFMATFEPAVQGEVLENPIPVSLAEAYSLGRKQNLVKYFCFTAQEEGTYQLSAHVQGYVRYYDEAGASVAIPKDYVGGTDFHNETFTLAAGQKLVFSVEPNADIEHLSVGIQDFFIPDHFVMIGRTDEAGQTFGMPQQASQNHFYDLTPANTWYGPVVIPAGEAFEINVLDTKSNTGATIFFANEKGQWINTEQEIQYVASGSGHTYTLLPAKVDRAIYLMSCGFTTKGYWFWGDLETGIEAAEVGNSTDSIIMYDLTGRKVRQAKGIVVMQNKKVLVK